MRSIDFLQLGFSSPFWSHFSLDVCDVAQSTPLNHPRVCVVCLSKLHTKNFFSKVFVWLMKIEVLFVHLFNQLLLFCLSLKKITDLYSFNCLAVGSNLFCLSSIAWMDWRVQSADNELTIISHGQTGFYKDKIDSAEVSFTGFFNFHIAVSLVFIISAFRYSLTVKLEHLEYAG